MQCPKHSDVELIFCQDGFRKVAYCERCDDGWDEREAKRETLINKQRSLITKLEAELGRVDHENAELRGRVRELEEGLLKIKETNSRFRLSDLCEDSAVNNLKKIAVKTLKGEGDERT
jgi:hypothetical protein